MAASEVVLAVVMAEDCQANTDLVCHGLLMSAQAGVHLFSRRSACICTIVKLPLEPRSLSCVACPKLSRIGLLGRV